MVRSDEKSFYRSERDRSHNPAQSRNNPFFPEAQRRFRGSKYVIQHWNRIVLRRRLQPEQVIDNPFPPEQRLSPRIRYQILEHMEALHQSFSARKYREWLMRGLDGKGKRIRRFSLAGLPLVLACLTWLNGSYELAERLSRGDGRIDSASICYETGSDRGSNCIDAKHPLGRLEVGSNGSLIITVKRKLHVNRTITVDCPVCRLYGERMQGRGHIETQIGEGGANSQVAYSLWYLPPGAFEFEFKVEIKSFNRNVTQSLIVPARWNGERDPFRACD